MKWNDGYVDRTVISNIPEVNAPRFSSLHTLIRTLNPTLYEEERLRTSGEEQTMINKIGTGGPANSSESVVDRLTSTIFQAHRELSSSVETLGQDLNPYSEPWYLRSELWYLVDLLKRTLELDCTKRITAANALRHKFFVLFQ
jgi:serine/threonine protein kinase